MSFYYNRNIRQSMPNLGEPRPPDGEGQGRRDRGQGRQDQGQTRGQNTGLGQTRRGDLDNLGQTRRPWTQENPGHIRQSMSPDYPEEADDDDIDFTWVDNESRRYNWETNRANDFTATRQEDNPYGWRALGGTRFVPHSAGDLTETVVPRHTRRDEIPRHTRRDDSPRQTRRNEDIRATRAKENGASPPRHQPNRGLAATDIHGGLGRDFGGHVNTGFGDFRNTRGADNFAAGDNLGITRRADALGATQYGREMDRGYVDRNAQQPNGRYEKSKSKDKQNKHDKAAARKSKKPTREEVNNRMTGRHLDDINPVYDNRVTLPSTGPEQDLRRSKKEWKKAQKKGGLFSGMFSSFRDEDARSYADRGIGWKTMAANKGLMNNWHGYFGKIRTKWAPSVSEMDATWDQARGCNSNSSNSYSSSEDGSYKPCGLPRGCVIAIGVILGVLLLTAILVPVIILIGAEPEDSTKSLQQYDMELKVENYKYSDDLSNTSSDSFRNLSQAFCNEIENQANTDEYKGCIVTEMRNGSVVFVFTIIIQVTHTQLKTTTEVIVMMGLEVDGADTQALGDFQVNVQTIVIIESSAIDKDPLPKEVGYGGACSVTADCVTILSSCADSNCACNTNRVHNSATDTCEIINCGQLPSVDNADVSSDGTSYGDVLAVKCNTGHVTSGNQANETVMCTTNGTWGVTTKCIPINCTGTIVEDPVVLVDTNTESLDISYGSILEVTCKSGYETNDTVNVTCQVDGTWSESPVCTPVACAPYVAPTDSHKTADTTTGIYGDSISISCDVGYDFENENVTDEICQADMTWTALVVCLPVVCVDLTIPPNAVNVSGHMDGGVYEDMVVFECNEGYRLEDNSLNTTVTCLANMNWSPAVDCIKIQCETFTKPDKSTLNGEDDRFGDTITIICDPGYDITGNDVITCQSDTTWTTSGTCEPIDCAEFQTPANGVPPAQTNVTFGDAISDVACQSGFILIGELPTYCFADGSWPVFTCMEVNCTEDLTIPNGFVQGANATIVTFECKIGYALSGDGVVRCADTGEWETTSDCTIVDCGDYPDINHANVTLDAGTTYGDSLEVACETGYTLVAGGSGSTVTCQASGNWSHFPICELVDCGVYQLPDNSQIQDDVSETTFGTELTILCNEGYDLQGDSESVVCGQDGDWSTQPTCVIVDCGEPNAVTNGTFNVGATTFNTSFDVACDDGFEISGDATVVCTASGTWTDLPSCTRVSCGDTQLPDEVELVGQDGELFGDAAQLECIEGYQTDDVTVLTCQSNGTWSTAPTCTIKDCGGITVSNGTVHVSDTTYNSMATIDCDQGFYILGNVNITCLSTGLWEDIPTCFASDCGTYEPGANAYVEGLTIVCHEGYNLEGTADLICQSNDTWNEVGTCQPVPCTTPDAIDNGDLNPADGASDSYHFGDTLNVQCHDGFETDTLSIQCQSDGTWSAVSVCSRKQCPDFTIDNGHIVGQSLNEYVFEDTVNVTCEDGYLINGTGFATFDCGADGQWHGEATCERRSCPDFPTPDQGTIGDQSQDGHVYGDTVNVTCETGYLIDDAESVLIKCGVDGSWENAFTCDKRPCPAFEVPVNASIGQQSTEGHVYGDTINVTCENGFHVNDAELNVVTCGADGTWEGEQSCDRLACPSFEVPVNASIGDQSVDGHVYGDTINVTCESGFHVNHAELNVVTCGQDGTWEGEQTCDRLACPSFPIPGQGTIGDQSQNGHVYGDTVNVTCDPGYLINDAEFVLIMCGVDGNWENAFTCEKRPCPEFEVPVNASIGDQSTDGHVYQDTINVTCENGFHVNHAELNVVTCGVDGTWEGEQTCDRLACPDFPTPDQGTIGDQSQDGHVYGDTVNVTCNPGYLIDDAESVLIMCGVDGDWENAFTCKKRPCPAFEVPVNASIGQQSTDGHVYGDTINVTCENGFHVDDAELNVVTCGQDGTWKGEQTCDRLACPSFEVPVNASIGDQSVDGHVYGDTINVTCESGFHVNHAELNVVTCGQDGTWEGEQTCDRLACPSFPIPGQGTIGDQSQDGHVYGDTVNVTCDPGYLINDAEFVLIMCGVDGNWENAFTCEKRPCPEFEVPVNASIGDQSTDGHVYQDTINVTCENGFHVNHAELNVVTCGVDGTWEGEQTCDRLACPDFPTPDQGTIGDQSQDGHVYGDTVNVTCGPGYLIDDAEFVLIMCGVDGSWENAFTCDKRPCPAFEVPVNASIGDQSVDGHVYGDTINVTCEDGFHVNHAELNVVTCGVDGTWEGEQTCDRLACPSFTLPEHGTIGDQSQDGHVYGDTVNVTCNPGYLINDAEFVLIMCGVDGDWENAFTCKKRPCPAFEVPVNASIGQQSTDGHVYQDTINVTCENGFHVDDAELNVVTCGQDGTWKGEQTCDRLACPSFEVPVNASIGDQSVDGHVYGDTINVTCESGFHVNDAELNVVTCGVDGTWEGEQTCDRLACPSFPIPGQGTIGDQSQDGHVYGDTVNVTCNPGYLINDAEFVLIMCGVDGDWENAFTCEKRPCPEFEVPVNASIGDQSTDGHVYRDTINVTCENGFHVNDAELNVVTCGVDGTWEGEQTCERRGCPSYIIPDHGVVDDQSDGHVFGDSLNVTCINEGYQINQTDHAIVACNAEGQWDANVTCDARPCIPFEVPDHATVEDSTDGHVYRDVLEVTCVNGYLIEGTLTPSTNVTCGTDGQWVGDMVCERRSCPQFDVPANSSIGDQGTDGHRYMDNITVVCLEGFNLFGNATVVCEDDGSWANAPACVKCPNVDIPHGSIESTTEQNASIVCDDGYHLNGPQIVVCQEDGAWTDLPECLLNDCGDPPTVDNGVVTLVTNETTFNSTAEISCNDGFTLDGTMETTCLANSSWSWVSDCHVIDCSVYVPPTNVLVTTNTSSTTYNTTLDVSCDTGHMPSNGSATSVTCGNEGLWIGEPECSPVTCTMFDIPQDSSVNVTDTMTEFVYQDLIYVECSLGFVRIGDGNVYCESDGTWSAIPTCQPANCSGFEYLNHGVVQPVQELYTYKDTVTLTCGSGFETNSTNVAICTDTGAWNTTLACVKVTCPSYTSPANGAFETISQLYEFGDILNITCDVGYELIGSTSVMCQSNSTWSPSPTCEPIDCQGYTSPSNGAHEGNTTTYGSVVDITCNFGYVLNGSSTATCTETGDWSTGGECLPVDCGVFDTPTNSVQLTQDPSTTYGATVTFECNDGYLTNNETELTCAADGNWTGNPECNPVVCELFTIPGNATFLNSTDSTYTFGDTVTVECENGFIQNGSSDVSCTASGDWTALSTCTEISCSVFDISNGNVSFDSIYATITCDDKYTLSGDGTVECQSNGAWTNSPECILSGCGAFPVANNMQINNTNSAVFGDVISVECNEGYSLTGSDIVTCLNDSNWSDTVSCDVIDCGMPVVNEKYTLTNGNTTYNSTLQAECIPGLSPSDPDLMTLRCDETGNWDGEPQCVITGVITVTQSDTFLLEQEGSVTCAVTNALNWQRLVFSFLSDSGSETFMVYDKLAGSTTYGHDAIATDDGNDLAIKVTFDVLNCSHTGSYSCKLVVYNNETGVEIEGRGEQPQIKPTGVPITCENGYMLNGSSQASCTDNGELNAGGQCDPVDCGVFDTPTNSVQMTQDPSTTYGTTVTFECDDGYLTNNETEITCAADGNWTGNPECNPVVCDLFTIPGNATLLNSTDSTYTFGDTVTVECENGFVQNGSSDVSCTASGDWSALPSCSEVSCSVIQISNGNVVYNDSLSATITCDDKYTLSGEATIECQEHGEWTNSPECILSGCGAFPVANNMQINNTNSAVFGDVISVECNEGYSLTGSDIVTCLNDSNWSDTVSCDIIDCGMPVANEKYTLTNGNTTYNSTLQAKCIPGLSRSDPDLMTLRCDETGNWDGEPQCAIVGSVSLEQTGSFEIGNSASLVCRVTGALDWQKIGFVHIPGADVSELIIGLDNSTGIPQTVTAEGFNADIDISGSDVIMNVTFDDVSCSVTGMYLCTILVGEEEAPIDAETAMTQINLTATPTKPVISGPEELYAGREAEITCVGNVGMSAQGTFGSMTLEQQTSGAPEFTPIHSVNGDGCNGTVTLTYKKAFSSDLDVRCGVLMPDNGELFEYSDTHSIAVKQSYVAFEKTSYVFNIGEPAHLACDVANMPDWEQIVIRQGDNSTIFTLNVGEDDPDITGDMVTGSGSHWSGTDAHVIMEYATVPCLDIGALMYTCEAKVNGTWTSATTTTTIQKLPDVPILTLSREIIENKWTLGDRVFSCVGDIGSPSGHISVESNINGVWATLFTLDPDNLELNNNSIGGFIVTNSTASNNCSSYTQTLNFAFEKILIEFQAKKLRCVVTPSPDLIDGQIIKSDADTIMVVKENYCNDTTSTFLPHPYFCHLHIQCNDDATMGVPSPCPEDLCANVNSEPVTCNHCANIGGCTVTVPIDPTAERITCSPLTFDEVIGNSVTSGCVLTNVDIITSISVIKDGTTIYSVDNENGHDGVLVVSDGIQVNINISGSSLSLDFNNISCDHEGEYEIVFNNNTRSEMISLSPTSEPGVPVLTLPGIQRTDQVMEVTCAGEVGRGAGNTATGRVKLQVKFEGSADYTTYSTSTSPTCFSDQCTCNQTVSHQLTTSASWNNSLVRCVTMTGSDITKSSTEQQIQLQENLLSFDGGDKTAKIGDSFQLLCTVKGVDSMSTVTISRTSKLNGDSDLECSVAGNGTTDCRLDGITLTGLLVDDVIEVTLDLGQLKCHDEGDYTCLDVAEGSKALMKLTLTSDPKVTDVTLPIAKANGTTQWGSNLLQCSAELGYPAGVLRIEYQLQGGSDFVAVTSNAPPSNKLAEDISKANCQTNETVAYDQMTFDTSFNASQFRCSVFADDTSTTPLVSSPVSTMYVFEETICNGDAEFALNPFDCHMYLRCSGDTLSGTTCSQNCPTIFSNGTNVACSAPCDHCS